MNSFIALFVGLSVIHCSVGEFIVDIEGGKIAGEENKDFTAFLGIPYAESPVGELRFASPQKYSQKWEGVKEFKKYGSVCAQYDHFEYDYTGSEDCLFVNVFVPKSVSKSNEKVPVIFFIHGGAFMFGAGSFYGADNIMKQQNMVLVTVNYRLGILGFLSTEDSNIPGNFGLKDQAEALRWVQKNIAAFNGNPEKVTIVGYSAGGASVHLHYMSKASDGLFNNGISHSGVSINPWVMMENAREKAHQIAAHSNCPQNHIEMLKCLRGKLSKDLVKLAQKYQPFLYNPFSPFGVVVEPKSETAFLSDHPLNILKKGNFKKLPWILSQTQDEGLYPAAEFYNDEVLETINEQWDSLAPFILDFNGTTDNTNRKVQMSRKIRKHYLGSAEISKANFLPFDDIITDRLFKHGAFNAIKLQSKFSPSFIYHFRYKSLSGLAEYMSKSKDYIGISHGEDVLLIFSHSLRDIAYSDEEEAVSQQLIDLYYNFAKHGKPVYNKIELKEVTPDHIQALEIVSQANIVKLDESFGNVGFWDDVEKTLALETSYYDEL